MSKLYNIGDILDVQIEKIVPRGLGLAFAEKLTILVPLSVPGDRLQVRIREVKKRLAFAEIVNVVEPGATRTAPPCPYFGTCGGCDFQQLSYPAQLDAKVDIIRDCLHRIAKIEFEDDIEIIPSPKELGYRSRARWHIDRNKKAIGYFARDSHDVIDIAKCPKLTPELELAYEDIRSTTEWEMLWSDESEIEAATGDKGTSIVSEETTGHAELSFALEDDNYVYSAETFFQANKFLIKELIDAAIDGSAGQTAFDLYCGVGLFALPLARRFENVAAVEENSVAVQFAKKNVANAGLENVEIVHQSVERFLSQNSSEKPDLILIDPPRSGTEKGVIAAISGLKPAAISYVSCEPSMLARDLRMLIDGGYGVEKIVALDMFPQTHHVETVVRLARL